MNPKIESKTPKWSSDIELDIVLNLVGRIVFTKASSYTMDEYFVDAANPKPYMGFVFQNT